MGRLTGWTIPLFPVAGYLIRVGVAKPRVSPVPVYQADQALVVKAHTCAHKNMGMSSKSWGPSTIWVGKDAFDGAVCLHLAGSRRMDEVLGVLEGPGPAGPSSARQRPRTGRLGASGADPVAGDPAVPATAVPAAVPAADRPASGVGAVAGGGQPAQPRVDMLRGYHSRKPWKNRGSGYYKKGRRRAEVSDTNSIIALHFSDRNLLNSECPNHRRRLIWWDSHDQITSRPKNHLIQQSYRGIIGYTIANVTELSIRANGHLLLLPEHDSPQRPSLRGV
jgi:hypothetical protein